MVVVVTDIVDIIIVDPQCSLTSYAHLSYILIIQRFSAKYLVKKNILGITQHDLSYFLINLLLLKEFIMFL